MTDLVLVEQRGPVVILTLNRPEALNALNHAIIDRLMIVLGGVESDISVRAVVITGAGDKAFSAGADIREFAADIRVGPEEAERRFCRRGQAMTALLEAFPKPLIAAVNGIAFGGGCEITEAAHLAVASERAIFAQPDVRIGIPPTFGGTQRLPRLVGRKRALELLLTGDPFPACRALEMGLVNRVVPHAETISSAVELANHILRHSSLTISRILYAVARGASATMSEGLEIEREQFARMCSSEDLLEGLSAWLEKRPPAYSGA